jgi:hypothetical protein
MKTRMLIVASIWMFFVSAALPVHAQAGRVKVNVPFDFAVSDKMFRAGEYMMLEAPLGVSVQDEDGATIAMALASNVTGRSMSNKGQIIFHCYNEHSCFLSEVWLPTKDVGRQLFISGSESDMVAKANQREVAVLGEPLEK